MESSPREQVSAALTAVCDGTRDSRAAGEALLPLVYGELRRLAHARLGREPAGATLQTTALVHEAYLRLVGDVDPGWNGRAHFFGAAAQAMRRILVDRARARAREKRGGGRDRESLHESALRAPVEPMDWIALDEALERLAAIEPRKAKVVELRFFAGLEMPEIARALAVSLATVKVDWSYARAWLHREMSSTDESSRA